MKTFFWLLIISIIYITIFMIGFYLNEKLQEQRNQLYTCDTYAYEVTRDSMSHSQSDEITIQNAPEFCK